MEKYRIAFVDDERDLIEGYRELFQDSFEVETFASGAEYLNHLNKFEKNPYQVTITDYRMGEMNGIEMIQKTIQAKKVCPYILMSGHIEKQMLEGLQSAGALVQLIEKPADIIELENLIQKFCAQKT